MATEYAPLATERIVRISEAIQQEDDRDGGRLFDTWIPQVPAVDGEVMARISGNVIAADIIQLDQKARVIQAEPISLERTNIPKLKHGLMISETMQDLLGRIGSGGATAADRRFFDDYIARQVRRLLNGIRDRRELIHAAMMINDGDYNRMGIQFANLSWGMPSNLNVTVSPLWSVAATATPIRDIEDVCQVAEDEYGEDYDTIVMSRLSFNEMTATVEFLSRAQLYWQMTFPTGTFPTGDRTVTQQIAERILNNRRIILYDKRTQIEAEDASLSTTRFLAEDAVVLVNSADLMNSEAWDWANARVLETFPGNVPQLIGGFDGRTEGPVSYATGADPQGNPPGQVLWSVQRGFSRKHRLTVNAVLRV